MSYVVIEPRGYTDLMHYNLVLGDPVKVLQPALTGPPRREWIYYKLLVMIPVMHSKGRNIIISEWDIWAADVDNIMVIACKIITNK